MAKRIRLVHEAASATLAADVHKNASRYKLRHTDVLVEAARKLERLLTKRRKARRELRTLDAQIKVARRELNAVTDELTTRNGADDL